MGAARDSPATLVVVDASGTETVVARVDAACPDMVLVDLLARVQLAARRGGQRLLIRGAPGALRELIELCGLSCVLAVEPRGQAELGEQLGVEEVVEPGDPAF
jgi:ABC-type transporter Mla MlaB component